MDALFRLAMRERHGAVTRAKRAVYSTERGGSLSVETYLMDPAGEDGGVNRAQRVAPFGRLKAGSAGERERIFAW